MNELRELNAVEMSGIEGGAGSFDEFLAAALEALSELFSAELIGPIFDAVEAFFAEAQAAVFAFLEGLFGS